LLRSVRQDLGISQDLGIGPVVGSYEHSNEPSGSTKGGEFLDKLSDY